ncbi:MAG: hypothetical protein ANABAC_3247 [Anaerolineae bacterium]|nr:MAG: hypothetical protein ANABAC_3247 [Anaerolineae bacterium]
MAGVAGREGNVAEISDLTGKLSCLAPLEYAPIAQPKGILVEDHQGKRQL